MREYISGLHYVPLIYVFNLLPISQYLGYCTFIVNLEIGFYEVSKFGFYFHIILAVLEPLLFHIYLKKLAFDF